MNESPLVSVIIPVYNVEAYLKRCLDSVVNQTYKNLQIILVDDGSLDNCGVICDQYAAKDNRITVIHQENGGLSAARNTGIELIRGDYTTFVDSDDWIHLNMIKVMVEVALEKDVDVVTCNHLPIWNDDVTEQIDDKNNKVTITQIDDYLKRYFRVSEEKILYYAWGKLYKSTLIVHNMYPVGLTHEDILGTFRAIKGVQKVAEIDCAYYYYYQSKNSITHTRFSERNFDYFPVFDILISECEGEYKNFAKYNKLLYAYSVLLRMAREGVARSDQYRSWKKFLLNEVRGDSIFFKYNHTLKRRIISVFIRGYYAFQ